MSETRKTSQCPLYGVNADRTVKTPWCPSCQTYKGAENDVYTCPECGRRGFACCVPGPNQPCYECYGKTKLTGVSGMKVVELLERLKFLRKHASTLSSLAEEARKEAVKVVELLREQGVTDTHQTHRYGCCNTDEMHMHDFPDCCSPDCWCQRDLQVPKKGKK